MKRAAPFAGLVLGLCLVSAEAHAQLTLPVRVEAPMTAVDATHPLGMPDCLNNNVRIQVAYTGTTTFNELDMWIGADAMTCTVMTARMPPTPTCWQITSATITGQQSAYNNSDFHIPARFLIDPIAGNCVTPQTPRGTIATNYLSLLVVNSAGINVAGMALGIPFDLDPPAPATGVAAVPGEGTIQVTWSSRITTATVDPDSGATTTTTTTATTDLAGFWLLCDPPAGAVASTDAGTSDGGGVDVPDQTFGVDSGSSGSTACTTTFPTINLYDNATFNRYVRGVRTSSASTSATAVNLDNGTAYRCVIVAEDNAGNRSISAPTACVVPVPVTDFWERYRSSGGAAQPIACAARPGERAASRLACIALFATAVGLYRRRRSKS